MRFSLVLVPAFLVLAGTGYFIARPKENAGLASIESRLDPSPMTIEDRIADEEDAELIRNTLKLGKPGEAESAAMVGAAGRRYMRRKMAYDSAMKAGAKTTPQTLESLRQDMDRARRVCDLTENFGRRRDLATIEAEIEMEQRLTKMGLAEHHDGRLTFSDDDLKQLEREFQSTFGRPLPVSAHGESSVHRAMGFDHRGRTDVAVSPDTTEGAWVRRYLTAKGVSFYAFRSAVKGKATGAHIHIGPASGKRTPGT
jgi:hypothetical protein